jgi:hypothetical protein
MLINNNQIFQLNEFITSKFVLDVCRLLRTYYEDLLENTGTNESIKVLVSKQVEIAKSEFGILKKKNLYQFVLVSLKNRVLLEKELPKEILTILTWPDRDEDTKIQALKNYFSS